MLLINIYISEKPKRPPPPARPPPPTKEPQIPGLIEDEDDFDLGPDPFDTTYVERIVPKSIDYDDDFDPRAAGGNTLQEPEVDLFATPNIENKSLTSTGHLTVLRKDLLSNSTQIYQESWIQLHLVLKLK